MAIGALLFVTRLGHNVPFSDEWELMPEVAGERPLSVTSLWAPHAEHRIPLAKLLFVSVLRVTDGSFRAGMIINSVILSVLAFALILTMRALRGGVSYSDALFPLTLLTFGNYANLLWWWQINFLIPLALVVLMLVIVVRNRAPLSTRWAIVAGIDVVLLSLNGPGGLPYVPPMAIWLAYSGFLRWRSPEPQSKRAAMIAWCAAGVALLLVPLNLIGLPHNPRAAGVGDVLRTTVQLLSTSFGPAAGRFWAPVGVGVLGLLAAGGGLLLWVGRTRPHERLRAAGLLSLSIGTGILALALGWARGGFADHNHGLEPHYVVLALPAVYGAYFTWGAFYPTTVGRFVQMCLFLVASSLFWQNLDRGLEVARRWEAAREDFERDLRAGLPPQALGQRYWLSFYAWDDPEGRQVAKIADTLCMLHRGGVGQFRLLQTASPAPAREVSLPLKPAMESPGVAVKDGTGQSNGTAPFLVFALPEAQPVTGIRLRCSYEHTEGAPLMRVSWCNGDAVNFKTRHFGQRKPAADEHAVTVWVYDTIDRFRVEPGADLSAFKISEITLLLPATDATQATDP
jgi:hypothetical protein